MVGWPQPAARHPHSCSLLHLQWDERENMRNRREKIRGVKQRQGDHLVAVVTGNSCNLGNFNFPVNINIKLLIHVLRNKKLKQNPNKNNKKTTKNK